MTAAVGPSKARVLQLYRRILRTGYTWDGPEEEKSYILHEARSRFRANTGIADGDKASKLIRDGEERLEYAVHYRIPYPRLEHANQFPKRYFLQAPEEDVAGTEPSEGDTGSRSKLDKAMMRRKQVGSLENFAVFPQTV